MVFDMLLYVWLQRGFKVVSIKRKDWNAGPWLKCRSWGLALPALLRTLLLAALACYRQNEFAVYIASAKLT